MSAGSRHRPCLRVVATVHVCAQIALQPSCTHAVGRHACRHAHTRVYRHAHRSVHGYARRYGHARIVVLAGTQAFTQFASPTAVLVVPSWTRKHRSDAIEAKGQAVRLDRPLGNACGHACAFVCGPAVDMCVDMCLDICMNLCVDLCVDMRVGIQADMYADMRAGLQAVICVDMHAGLCV